MFPGSTTNGQWGPRRPQKVPIKWEKAHLGAFIAQSFALQYRGLGGLGPHPTTKLPVTVQSRTRLPEAKRYPPFLLLSKLIQVAMFRWDLTLQS